MSEGPNRTLVVGAGPAGLSAATALQRRGEEVQVLEAGSTPGGWCRSIRREGYVFEIGPQTWRAPAEGAIEEVLGWAGLRDEVRDPSAAANKRFLLRHGQLRRVPAALPGLLGPGACLRALSEYLRAPRRRPRETVASFVRRRFGPALVPIADAFVSGVFAGDARRLELASAFPSLAQAERDYGSVIAAARGGGFPPRQIHGLERGMGSFSEALAAGLGPRLRCDARVVGLVPRRGDAPWEVELASGERLAAERLVLATPAFAAAELLAPHDPVLGGILAGIPYAHVAVVSLGYDRSAFRAGPPEGFGFLAPRREGRRILGCIFASAVFPHIAPPGKVSLRIMIGGLQDPDAIRLSEERLLELARREVEPLLGVTRPPEVSLVLRIERAIPQYVPGHGRRVEAIDERARRWPGLTLIGNAYRGVSVADTVSYALERVGT